jgi:dTDP-4-amino-4,6-dideoxygalactose transaminase
VQAPGFGRQHSEPGYALRMALCSAAISLAQLEIVREQVARRDRMIRLLSRLVGEVPGIMPLPIPGYMNVYSAWMFSLSLGDGQFRCSADEFAAQLVQAGIPGAGTGRYYLMPMALTFLQRNARQRRYPYSQPPASREFRYDERTCPTAWEFLQRWVRWATFCEKYTEEHCALAARIVGEVAERNRK